MDGRRKPRLVGRRELVDLLLLRQQFGRGDAAAGIVRTTWPWPPTGRRLRDVSDPVSPAPFPADRDSACGLALPAFHPELSRCRGAACTAWARPLLREGPELGVEIRPDEQVCLRREAAALGCVD